MNARRAYNGPYIGENLNRIAFPIGGIGAGMYCLEGHGQISHMSVRNTIEFFHTPPAFAAICVKGEEPVARVVEGPLPEWKYFGMPAAGNGSPGTTYGLPRFREGAFEARFPFCTLNLKDEKLPLEAAVTGWSPFTPGEADDSSLPLGALEYTFTNPTDKPIEAVFSFNTTHFMKKGKEGNTVQPMENGFILNQAAAEDHPEHRGAFAFFTDRETVVDHCWFKGGWFDGITLCWKTVSEGKVMDNPPVDGPALGASLFVPLTIAPGASETVRLMTAWYVPDTAVSVGKGENDDAACSCGAGGCGPKTHQPWYVTKFQSVAAVAKYWRKNYDALRAASAKFRDAFYDTTLPPEVVEAVAANLTILKSPTVLRQPDGRLWAWEGCSDNAGCCAGSCQHVWNYAQAIPHLFPDLERTFRQTEYGECQMEDGKQVFRSNLPIRPNVDGYAASDGQLGGIMKLYRDWRISGDTEWLREYWPKVTASLEFCIAYWDPRETGLLEEHHHNTYDIDYWGPDGHCGSFYLGALLAACKMGAALGKDTTRYAELLEKGKKRLNEELWNGEYYFHKVESEGYERPHERLNPEDNGAGYREIIEELNKQGPKYQYGKGCLSDGVLGLWMARVCGIDEGIVPEEREKTNLASIHRHNLRHSLLEHANPQRPSFAMGDEGGLLLCTWPHGGRLDLPFVYSEEVWTGIEYQVASHCMLMGLVDEGLEIVRLCRDRYDGRRRNPFNEYECGHWYARAMSSYGLIQGLTGLRYDAVDETLYLDPRIEGDFRTFLSTAGGYGTAGIKDGKPFIEVKSGGIPVKKVVVSGTETSL